MPSPLPQGNEWPQAGAGFQLGLSQEELGAPSPAAPSYVLPGSLLFLGWEGGGGLAPEARGIEQGWEGEQWRCWLLPVEPLPCGRMMGKAECGPKPARSSALQAL